MAEQCLIDLHKFIEILFKMKVDVPEKQPVFGIRFGARRDDRTTIIEFNESTMKTLQNIDWTKDWYIVINSEWTQAEHRKYRTREPYSEECTFCGNRVLLLDLDKDSDRIIRERIPEHLQSILAFHLKTHHSEHKRNTGERSSIYLHPECVGHKCEGRYRVIGRSNQLCCHTTAVDELRMHRPCRNLGECTAERKQFVVDGIRCYSCLNHVNVITEGCSILNSGMAALDVEIQALQRQIGELQGRRRILEVERTEFMYPEQNYTKVYQLN